MRCTASGVLMGVSVLAGLVVLTAPLAGGGGSSAAPGSAIVALPTDLGKKAIRR